MRRRLHLAPVLLVPLALLALGGCGGGEAVGAAGSTSSEGTTTAATANATQGSRASDPPGSPQPAGPPSPHSEPPEPGPPASAFRPTHHEDSGGGSAPLIVKGADNSVQEYGAESGVQEFEGAAATLHDFLDARAERNWAAACHYLSAATKQSFARLAGAGPKQSCPAELAALSGQVPTATLREAAIADVASLRAEGARGFLLYRGAPKGTLYAISMTNEQGSWKVASLAGTPLN